MQFITISGLDGSGKSTQIEMLKQELEHTGSKIFYFHAIDFSLAKKINNFKNKYCLICKLTGQCKTGEEKSVTHATPFQIFLRKIFLRIDLWRFSLLRNKLRNKGYDYILSDRYFYDSIINIEYLESIKNPKVQPLDFQRLDLRISKPDVAIYLQTSPDSIMSRERVPDQGLEYLEKKKALYDAQAAKWNMKVINGNQDKNEIFTEIINYVNSN